MHPSRRDGMAAEWEYTVVELPSGGGMAKRVAGQMELINRVAAHGWRLMQVTSDNATVLAYFERPASGA